MGIKDITIADIAIIVLLLAAFGLLLASIVITI